MAGGHYFPREELPALVTWLNSQRRDPLPAKLTVVREASHFQPFGWVRIDVTDPIAAFSEDLIDKRDQRITHREYARLEATIVSANRIEVNTERIQRYSLFLNDRLIDPAKPLMVLTNGRLSFEGTVTASLETLLRQARLRQDPRQLFPIHVAVEVPKSAVMMVRIVGFAGARRRCWHVMGLCVSRISGRGHGRPLRWRLNMQGWRFPFNTSRRLGLPAARLSSITTRRPTPSDR